MSHSYIPKPRHIPKPRQFTAVNKVNVENAFGLINDKADYEFKLNRIDDMFLRIFETNDVFDISRIAKLAKFGMYTKATLLYNRTLKFGFNRFVPKDIILLQDAGLNSLAKDLFEKSVKYVDHYDLDSTVRLYYSGLTDQAMYLYNNTIHFTRTMML
jgi:hypothetical protein